MNNRIEIICNGCGKKFKVIPSRKETAKYCSTKCSNNRVRTADEIKKISDASKQKYIDNPELRNVVAENGRLNFKKMNADGTAFRMPKGYHTEEHKKYMSELMSNRDVSDETREKIKSNHWSNGENKNKILDKIKKSKEKSERWNNPERKNRLTNWSLDNPEKCGPKFYKKGKYKSKKTGIIEYYASGFELEHMKKLDLDNSVIFWTKKHKIKIDYIYHGKVHKYIPDFLIEYEIGERFLVELKGRIYNQEIIDIKNKVAIEYCNKNNLHYEIIYQ